MSAAGQQANVLPANESAECLAPTKITAECVEIRQVGSGVIYTCTLHRVADIERKRVDETINSVALMKNDVRLSLPKFGRRYSTLNETAY